MVYAGVGSDDGRVAKNDECDAEVGARHTADDTAKCVGCLGSDAECLGRETKTN